MKRVEKCSRRIGCGVKPCSFFDLLPCHRLLIFVTVRVSFFSVNGKTQAGSEIVFRNKTWSFFVQLQRAKPYGVSLMRVHLLESGAVYLDPHSSVLTLSQGKVSHWFMWSRGRVRGHVLVALKKWEMREKRYELSHPILKFVQHFSKSCI